MRNKIKIGVLLWIAVMLTALGSVWAAEMPTGDISFIKTEDSIAAKAYRQDTLDIPCRLYLAVYEGDRLKNVAVTPATGDSQLCTEALPLTGENETVKAFFMSEDLFPLSRVYTPMEEKPSFTATATVYGKTYPGRVNRKLHTITFDVPKTMAEDLNASVPREENGYLPIGNHHFDTSYTIALSGASAACDGEAISSGTAFPVGGDRTLAITDQSGNTENYTVEVHISETAAVTEHSDGFSVSGIAERGLADKLTVTHSFTVQSVNAESDLFRMGSEALPLSAVVTTKEQAEGYFTLRIGGAHSSACAVSGQIPALLIGKPYTLTYLFRKTTDGGICEMYIENTLLATAPCSETELTRLGGGQDISFYTARIGGGSGSINLSDISAAMVRPRPALYVEKLPDGKNAAYTFTADDGFVGSAKWYYNTFKNLGLRGSLALNSSTADVSGLTPYVSDGVFDIGNHGKTHKVLTNLEDTALNDEVTNGQAELREKFPGSSVLTMYLPNNQKDDTVMQKLHESHYAVRCSGANRSNSLYLGKEGLYTTTFYAVNSGENKTDLARLKWRFDDARSKGRWIVEMWHEVKGDDVDGTPKLTDPYVYDSAEAKQYFTYVASHLDEVYSGGYETMVQYLLERDYLRMQQLTAEADKMTYRAAYDSSMLLRPEDAAYFKTPLTVNAVVPDEWRKVLVTQGENAAVYPVYREQSAQLGAKERNYILFDIVPGDGEITLQSVPEDYEILGDEAEISAASVKVGIYHYAATINPESHTMTFAIPYTALKSETEAAAGKISPGVTPDFSKLEMTLTGEGRMTADGVRVDKTFTFDADKLKEITAEAKEKRVTYQVKFVPMVLAGRYNCNGATLTSTTETQASRRGVPKLLNDGNVYFGNSGDGIWRINQSAMAYLDDGSVDEANTYAHLQIASRTDDSENQYIRFIKDKNTAGTSARVQLYRQNNYGNSGVKTLRSKVSFNLHSFTKNNDGMIYLWSSDLDQIVLSSKGMNNNRFTLCHRGTTNDFMQPFETSPVLETNTWYTLICDFVRTEAEEHGYYMDVYLQKEGETMQRLGRISNQATCPSGKINWQDNKNEFMLAAWSNAIFDLGIDDYEIMTVIDDTQYDTSVYLLGDSICRYYDPSKLAPQQGWGEYVFSMFRDNVRVRNYSVGGYNTNIYLHGANRPEPNKKVSPPILPSILRELHEGDYVMVALGWNEANRYDGTKNTAAFMQNLAQIADRCKEKGASVIFVTATPNLTQDYTALANSCLTGLYSGTECVYPVTDMKNFAAQNGYPCLDLNTAMYARLSAMQPSEYKEVFTGSSSADPNNSINKDYLHLTQAGAELAGQLIQELLADSSSPLKAYLK